MSEKMERVGKGFFILFFCLIPIKGISQEIGWKVGISSFFDNSEFDHSIVRIPQTMAGLHLSPELVLGYDTVHSIHVGADMLHEFGSDGFVDKLTPTAYYMYQKSSFLFLMGSYPRRLAVETYPRLFFQDSVAYYRPNMNGLLLEYTGKSLSANLWLDWTSRQSHTAREAFIVGFSGQYKRDLISVGNYTYMYHFAGVMEPISFDPLHDNILSFTYLGIDFAEKTNFEKLFIKGGWAVGWDRSRGVNTGWLAHNGFMAEAAIQYKKIGIFNSLYRGESQMYYYADHTNELYWGDPFYRRDFYNRTDIYIDFIKSDRGSIKLIYSLHASGGELYHQQLLKMSFNIGTN